MKCYLLTPIRIVLTLFAVLCALVPQRASCQLRFSEIQQSNIGTLLDDLNEFPDSWVELRNPTNRIVSTKDYAIGTTPDPEAAWPLPAKRVMPYGFTTVLCDMQASGWHTDFRLNASGGSVYLFRSGAIVDSLKDYPRQPAPGISYGYPQDGPGYAMWLIKPTPGMPNAEAAAERILPPPMFSRRGFVAIGEGDPVQISLIPPAYSPEGAEIRYTLNGKEPTERDSLYRRPIALQGTTTVRAKYFAEGHFPSATATQSYIFHPRERMLPVISIVTDSAYLYDEKIGIDVTGSYSEEQPNFYYNWRRPANIELFEPGQAGSAINQLCEIRMSGNDGGRKHHPLRPMIVYAHERFGTKHFKHELFPEDKPGKKDFKSIMLRNSGNDFGRLYFRDAIIQRSVGRNVDLDWQAYRPAIVYVNGVYHGLLNMRERSQEDNVFTNHHGIKDIDLVEYWWKVEQGNAGDLEAFSKLYKHDPHADLHDYERVMDVQEFADYFIMELFYNNTDWPANNTRMWRPTAPDGRWRWIAYDTDVGLGRDNSDPHFPSFDWMYGTVENPQPEFWYWGNDELGTALWRRLISIPEFRDYFIMRFTVHMGDFLRADLFDALADTMSRSIASEYPHHAQRWGICASDHDEQLEFVKKWVRQRIPYLYGHIAEHFGLGNPHPLLIDARTATGLTIDDIPVQSDYFDGQFYEDAPLTVGVVPSRKFLYWELKYKDADGEDTTEQIDTPAFTIPMPADSLHIIAVTEDIIGIQTPLTAAEAAPTFLGGYHCITANAATDMRVQLYDSRGALIRTVTLQAGTNTISDLPPGIYIVERKKVLVR